MFRRATDSVSPDCGSRPGGQSGLLSRIQDLAGRIASLPTDLPFLGERCLCGTARCLSGGTCGRHARAADAWLARLAERKSRNDHGEPDPPLGRRRREPTSRRDRRSEDRTLEIRQGSGSARCAHGCRCSTRASAELSAPSARIRSSSGPIPAIKEASGHRCVPGAERNAARWFVRFPGLADLPPTGRRAVRRWRSSRPTSRTSSTWHFEHGRRRSRATIVLRGTVPEERPAVASTSSLTNVAQCVVPTTVAMRRTPTDAQDTGSTADGRSRIGNGGPSRHSSWSEAADCQRGRSDRIRGAGP